MTYRYRPGDYVVDGTRALAGQVRDVHGSLLTLARPNGYSWDAKSTDCWTASPQERASMTPQGAVRIISTAPPPAPPSS
ncbi:hypothetical protein OG357_22870 [Streptomyces sp. NBC_01255]|uniref:hypothetical protein n=1 Tax=Streptomyces sp. NBC_01255 TaxID=2903798 RepID=UPI002E34695A|nr:hypothetical protein [Streptomyces sp. NBC_01255]